ncbi:TonB-dependent receptor [Pseudomonas aeruginosa]|nr:TonB-dependent receptor [Pseudomonas aeruginosa]
MLGYEFSHEFNDVWTFKQNTRYAYIDDQYVAPLHGYNFVPNPNTGANDQRYTTRYGVDWSQTNKAFGIDNMLQAKFKTGEISHTALVGVDYYHYKSKFLGLLLHTRTVRRSSICTSRPMAISSPSPIPIAGTVPPSRPVSTCGPDEMEPVVLDPRRPL